MSKFGKKYDETLKHVKSECEACGAPVTAVESKVKDPSEVWFHTIRYRCGLVIGVHPNYFDERDLGVHKPCSNAYDVAVKLRKQLGQVQAALDTK